MSEKLYVGGGLNSELTRFGTLSHSVNDSNTHLRMIGFNNGLDLKECTEINAAAAVIGADTWMMLIGGNGVDLTKPKSSDKSAIKVLANIILRSCGNSNEGIEHDTHCKGIFDNDLTLSILKEQSGQEMWLRKTLGYDTYEMRQVFCKVSSDFASAGEYSALTYYNELLINSYLD